MGVKDAVSEGNQGQPSSWLSHKLTIRSAMLRTSFRLTIYDCIYYWQKQRYGSHYIYYLQLPKPAAVRNK
jgi:hypothetical protein